MLEAYLNKLLEQIVTQGKVPEANLFEYSKSGSSLVGNHGNHHVQDTLQYRKLVNPEGVQQHIPDQGNTIEHNANALLGKADNNVPRRQFVMDRITQSNLVNLHTDLRDG